MSDYSKFLKIPFRVWWIIFLVSQIFLIALMIGSLATPRWVYSDNDGAVVNLAWSDEDNFIYEGDEFEGGLYACTESCDKDWGKLAEEWCDYWNDLDDIDEPNYFEEAQRKNVQSICYLYFALYIGMSVYSSFEIISIICISVWACSMFLYCKKIKFCLVLSFCCSGCVWSLHYLGFIFYMIFTKSNFYGDCDEFDTETNPTLCATDGPGLALFIAIILPLIVVAYCIVGCNLKNHHGPEGLHKKEEKHSHHDDHAKSGGHIDVTHNYPSVPAGNNNYYSSGPTEIKH